MTPRIVAVGTAVRPHRFTQPELLAMAGYADERRRGFFSASDITGRHLWIDPARFRRVVFAVLLVSGLVLLVRG